jgi:hypothetical protein
MKWLGSANDRVASEAPDQAALRHAGNVGEGGWINWNVTSLSSRTVR